MVQKQWFWFIMVMLLVVIPAAAQADTPPAVREAALDAGEAALGVRSENWRFQALNPTNDSALGCPLVKGEEMPLQVTPYRVELIYPDGIYVVYVSVDGRMAQLCDSKFGDVMTSPADAEEDPNACTVTPTAAQPAYAAPDNTMPGVFTAAANTAYKPFGRSSDSGWYQIASDIGIGWVDAETLTIKGDCAKLPATSFTVPDYTGPACFVTAASAFSNVRIQPSVDSAQVAQIFENAQYQASARNRPSDWYYIQPGWVAARVTTQVGDCTALTLNEGLVGTGFAEDLPGEMDESVALALSEYPCAADFKNYMRPRLEVGFANAQVEVSGIPNTLRSFPDANDAIGERLGVIQPGRTIDRVISGPVCNQGFVWWLVEFDGQVGWTAESNAASNDYYLEPLNSEGLVIIDTTNTTENTSDSTDTTDTTDTGTTTPDDAARIFRINDRPITALVFTKDGSRLFAAGEEAGFGSGINGFVSVWNMASEQSEGRIDVPTGVTALAYASEADLLLVASHSGVITLYSAADPNLTAVTTNDSAFAPNLPVTPQVAISPDGSTIAILACPDVLCTTSQLQVISSADGGTQFTMPFDEVMQALTISSDGTQIAVAGDSGVTFIAASDGSQLGFYTNTDGLPIYDVAFKGDTTQALVAGCALETDDSCTRGRIALVDVASQVLLGIVESHVSEAQFVVYNPNDASFATADSGGEIIIRNSTTGTDLATFSTGSASATSLAFTPNGSQILAGTSAGFVVFFDTSVGEG